MKLKSLRQHILDNPGMTLQSFSDQFFNHSSVTHPDAKQFSYAIEHSLFNFLKNSSNLLPSVLINLSGQNTTAKSRISQTFQLNSQKPVYNADGAKLTKSCLRQCLDRLNTKFSVQALHNMSDKDFAKRSPEFIQYMLVAEYADEIQALYPEDNELKANLETLKNLPQLKYINARMSFMTNPFYQYALDSKVSSVKRDFSDFEPEKLHNFNNLTPEMKEKFNDLSNQLYTMRSIATPDDPQIAEYLQKLRNSVSNSVAGGPPPIEMIEYANAELEDHMKFENRFQNPENQKKNDKINEIKHDIIPEPIVHESNNIIMEQQEEPDENEIHEEKQDAPVDQNQAAATKSRICDYLKDKGYTDDEIGRMTFIGEDGQVAGNIDAFSHVISLGLFNHGRFFVALPGEDIAAFENTFSQNANPARNVNIHENILTANINHLTDDKVKAAHIRSGSSQYKKMEELFASYRNMVSQPDFDKIMATRLISDVKAAADAYLNFKKSQRGTNEYNIIKAKNDTEKRRINLAIEIRDFASNGAAVSQNIINSVNIEKFTQKNISDNFPQLNALDRSAKKHFIISYMDKSARSAAQDADPYTDKDGIVISPLSELYPGVDPVGKHSDIELDAASRMAKIRAAYATRPDSIKTIFSALTQLEIDKELTTNMVNASRSFRNTALYIHNLEDGNVKNKAVSDYNKTKESNEAIRDYNLYLTGLEYIVGLRRGTPPKEIYDFYLKVGIDFRSLVKNDAYVPDRNINPVIMDFQNPEAAFATCNFKNSEAKQKAISDYLVATTKRTIDPLFSNIGKGTFDKGNYIIIDGKSARERCIDRFFAEKAYANNPAGNPIASLFEDYYEKNGEKLIGEMTGAALLVNKPVQVFIPDPTGRIGNTPATVKKTGYSISTSDKDVIDFLSNTCRSMGIKNKDPDYTLRNNRAMVLAQAKNVNDIINNLRVSSANQFNYTALWGDKPIPALAGFSLERSALASLGISILAGKGYSIKDLLDPTKLVKEKNEVGLDILNHAQNGDSAWIIGKFCDAAVTITEKFEAELFKFDWTNPDVFMSKDMAYVLAFDSVIQDITQEIRKVPKLAADYIDENYKGDFNNIKDPNAKLDRFTFDLDKFGALFGFVREVMSTRQRNLDGLSKSNLADDIIITVSLKHGLGRIKEHLDANDKNSFTKSVDSLKKAYDFFFHNAENDPEVFGLDNFADSGHNVANHDLILSATLAELNGKISKSAHIELTFKENGLVDEVSGSINIDAQKLINSSKDLKQFKNADAPKYKPKKPENDIEKNAISLVISAK